MPWRQLLQYRRHATAAAGSLPSANVCKSAAQSRWLLPETYFYMPWSFSSHYVQYSVWACDLAALRGLIFNWEHARTGNKLDNVREAEGGKYKLFKFRDGYGRTMPTRINIHLEGHESFAHNALKMRAGDELLTDVAALLKADGIQAVHVVFQGNSLACIDHPHGQPCQQG